MRKITTLILFVLALHVSMQMFAQQASSGYFLENIPVRNSLNPSFQPLNDYYFSIPLLGNNYYNFDTDLGAFKNAGMLSGVTYNIKSNNQLLLNAFKNQTQMNGNMSFPLFEFGKRYDRAFWTFGIAQRMQGDLLLPKDLAGGILNGIKIDQNTAYNFSGLNMNMAAFTEAALGYSRYINENLSYGLKLKYLYGNQYMSVNASQLTVNSGNSGISAVSATHADIASNFINTSDLSANTNMSFLDYIKPIGMGGAIDLGVTYKPVQMLTLSASVTDLGLIYWNKVKSVDYQLNYNFSAAELLQWKADNPSLSSMPADTLMNHLLKSLTSASSDISVQQQLTPSLFAGAEIGVFRNKLSLGVLSHTQYRNSSFLEEVTASVNIKPVNWYNMALSYSVMNGRMSNVGAAFGLRTGKMHWYIAADYIPLNYAYLEFENVPVAQKMSVPVGLNHGNMRLSFGINYVIGQKQDADLDGISDQNDRCDYTPAGVKVDKYGCPVDTDKDGVPDFYDRCANTPADAIGFIDSYGCPTDKDGDKVPDYLDFCPNNTKEANAFVDEKGCPKDSDQDGVLDYIDKCPDTAPTVQVDSVGCPLDTDKDGVPDHNDLCPETPVAARGMVDKNGCPFDKDEDGVLDFLDLCLETPLVDRKFIDANGCLKDQDDDGVKDYVDNCPNTPAAARGYIDDKGCLMDSDSDGIPDYEDICPRLPGVKSNQGCPEVKKEIRKLFQKALTGIQFESGKAVLKSSSNIILDQLVQVMLQNTDYKLDIQGHTDSQGDSLKNRVLSDERALAVKNYLINKGISESRLSSKGFGSDRPIADNKTAQGRSKNRRVEFVVSFEEVKYEDVKFEEPKKNQ